MMVSVDDVIQHCYEKRKVDKDNKLFLLMGFPEHKRQLGRLSLDQKLEWYATQFQKDPQGATILFSSPEFARFWKWRVLMPMKFKRLYYRIKNGEIFKKYPHITEIKAKRKI